MLVFRTALKYNLKKGKFIFLKNSRSLCDYCGNQLSWWENIPILSWLIQGGKTRCCRRQLPFQYPVVEFLTGCLFVVINFPISSPNYFIIFSNILIVTLLVFSAVFDYNYYILPDFANYILILIAIVLNWSNWWVGLLASGFLLSLNILTKGRGMGIGDVKLAVFIGIYLGSAKTVLAFYLAFVAGAIIGILLIIIKKMKKNSQIPFGPYLIAGTLVSQVWGEKLLYYVYRWM